MPLGTIGNGSLRPAGWVVVVVPAALEQQVAELARLQDELDNFSIGKITSGVPLRRAYPLDAELRAEFDATH